VRGGIVAAWKSLVREWLGEPREGDCDDNCGSDEEQALESLHES